MITANVFQRTFFIKSGNSTGTAFSIDVDNRRYLVTASHVCADGENTTEIQIYHEATWKNLPVKVVGMGDPTRLDADIAVLAADTVFGAAHPLPAGSEGLIWGQDVYFLGYPYGLHTLANVNGGFPLPLVKRALMSGSIGTEFEVFLLDGHNNPGFSGGAGCFQTKRVTAIFGYGCCERLPDGGNACYAERATHWTCRGYKHWHYHCPLHKASNRHDREQAYRAYD